MHLIRNVDCLGREIHFLIHHKQLYQSVIGGILSIIVTMFFFSVLISLVNDYESAKNCNILSQTFYIDDKDHNKIYLFESIIDNKWLTSTEFWYGVIECMIDQEFQKNESSNKEINAKETEEEKAKRISNIAFSQVLPYTNNMLDFKMDKNVILEVINSFVEKYKIESDFAEAIINNVKETIINKNI